MIEKRAQLTFFIIFALIIVFGLVLLFLFIKKEDISPNKKTIENPRDKINTCLGERTLEILSNYTQHGLSFSPKKYLFYSDRNVSYLCYVEEEGKICERDDSLLRTRLEREILERFSIELERCFKSLKTDLLRKGFEVIEEDTRATIEILPKKINFKIRKNVNILNNEDSFFYNNFDYSIDYPLFDFLLISNDILNEEVSCNCPKESCTADIDELMQIYSGFTIFYFISGSGEKVYNIVDNNGNKMSFAVRNCIK